MEETVWTILGNMLASFLGFLPKAIIGMVIFFIGLYLAALLAKAVQATLKRRKVDHEVALLASRVTRWSIVTAALFIALQQMGFNLSAFLVSLGVVGFTIGFALQDISKNLIAGLLLLIQQPFDIGDLIRIHEFTGIVTNIDLRATELHLLDGKVTLIPNADVYVSPITNYSREPLRRFDLTIGVAYDSDLDLVRDTAVQAASGIPGVLDDPAPSVVFQNFGDSAIGFTLYYWINARESDLFAVQNAVFLAVNAAFTRQNIEIPYPIQTVMMKQA